MLDGAAVALEDEDEDDAADPSPGRSARAPSKWSSRADSKRGIPGSCCFLGTAVAADGGELSMCCFVNPHSAPVV